MKEIIIYIDMRRFSVLLAAVSLVAFFPSCGSRNHSTSPDQTKEMKFSRLQAQFANPGKEYRAAPLWVWNTDVTTEDIDRTLTEMKEQGFGGAFVHPRPGLETEYLSDEWFRLCRDQYKYLRSCLEGILEIPTIHSHRLPGCGPSRNSRS